MISIRFRWPQWHISRCVVCVRSIDEQQERCRSRAVSSCDASTRNRINASYTAIHREWSKICYPSPPSALELSAGIGALSPCLWLHSLKIIRSYWSVFQIRNSTIFSALGLLSLYVSCTACQSADEWISRYPPLSVVRWLAPLPCT